MSVRVCACLCVSVRACLCVLCLFFSLKIGEGCFFFYGEEVGVVSFLLIASKTPENNAQRRDSDKDGDAEDGNFHQLRLRVGFQRRRQRWWERRWKRLERVEGARTSAAIHSELLFQCRARVDLPEYVLHVVAALIGGVVYGVAFGAEVRRGSAGRRGRG